MTSILLGDCFVCPADGLARAFGTPSTLAANAASTFEHSGDAARALSMALHTRTIATTATLAVDRAIPRRDILRLLLGGLENIRTGSRTRARS
jgi:hypothetical protein